MLKYIRYFCFGGALFWWQYFVLKCAHVHIKSMFLTWNRYLKGHRVGKNFRHKKWVFFYDFDEIRYWLLCGHFVFFLCARRLLRLLLKTTESHRQLDRWFNVQINSAKANMHWILLCSSVEMSKSTVRPTIYALWLSWSLSDDFIRS